MSVLVEMKFGLLIWNILFLIAANQADRVSLIACAKFPNCVEHVNEETLKVIEEHKYNSTDPCEDFWDYACESANFAVNDSSQLVVELQIPQPEKRFRNKYQVFEIFEEFEFNKAFPADKLWQLALEVYGLQRDLLELYEMYEGSSKQMQSVTLEEFQRNEGSLNWQLYFDSLAGRHLDPRTVQLEVPKNLDYFQQLQSLLKQQQPHNLAWYILLNFLKHLNNIKPLINSRNCLLHTNVMFPLGINYIYNRFLYKNRQKDEKILGAILKQLKQQFSLYLEENKFHLNPEELSYLHNKLNAVQLKIGNLPQTMPNLNEYHVTLHLSKHNFFANHLQLLKFRFYQQHKAIFDADTTLHSDLQQQYYVNDDITTLRNAPYFIHPRNMLLIPMVFLQLPFYHHRQYPLLQHSIVGWIMAHELSHAFDPLGLPYDHNGNHSPMGQRISQNPSFIQSLECLTENSPTLSLNERMADVNGLQLIWDIYSQEILKIDEGFWVSNTVTAQSTGRNKINIINQHPKATTATATVINVTRHHNNTNKETSLQLAPHKLN
ncbi:neprilysin-like 10 [Musca autumnalis]|uniref:neprilysin-like 10 n=1 Tax=Musca autumnalis TaxID=221902 RepID=UPI003CF3DCD8